MNRTIASTVGLLVLLTGFAAATTVACSSSSDADGAAACPADPPTPGSACNLPESSSCIYGDAAGASGCDHPPAFFCRSGQWNEPAEGAPQPLACPATRPATLSACETSCGSNRSCNYGECDSLDCIDGKWQPEESFAACIPDSGVDAATEDAGSDAGEGDADADADSGDGG